MDQTNDKKAAQPAAIEPNASGSRREERDSEYRRRILATASELFEKQGVNCVTMYQIAQEAGVGQGTLYRRYAHLGEVCSDLLRTTGEALLQSLEAKLAAAEPGTPALALLSDTLLRIIDFIDQKAPLLYSIHSMYIEKKSHSFHDKPIFKRLHNLLHPLIVRAVEQGEIRDIDATLTVNTILAAVSPNQYMFHREVLGYSKERFASGMCRLFVDGL